MTEVNYNSTPGIWKEGIPRSVQLREEREFLFEGRKITSTQTKIKSSKIKPSKQRDVQQFEIDDNTFYDVKNAADILGVTQPMLHNYLRKNKIFAVKMWIKKHGKRTGLFKYVFIGRELTRYRAIYRGEN